MKKSTKVIIAICGLVILSVVVSVIVFARAFDIGASKEQMDAAKKYMDSLTDKDIQAWIQLSQKYFAESPTNFELGLAPVSPDLQKLGITGIEVHSDEVDYVWYGGMDDTALDFVRASNGVFQVFAVYTPYSNRMIWPRQ